MLKPEDMAETAETVAPAVQELAEEIPAGMGWLRDLPDIRDYTPEHENIAPLLAKTRLGGTLLGVAPSVPASVDLRGWFSPVDDQGQLGSCTAHAADGLLEYYERRAFGSYTDISRRFVYKVTRDLLGLTGDTGAFVRSTMGTLALFGAPPEKYWPYDVARFDDEPTPFCYAFAQNFKALSYYRLDPPGTAPATLLDRIKQWVAQGFPPMFGFTVYDSIAQAGRTGKIPFPGPADRVVGGHAIVVAGYDDSLTVQHARPGTPATTGALLIKNSWGAAWGARGYGWLPYEYVLRGLTAVWWSLLKASWVETSAFGLL